MKYGIAYTKTGSTPSTNDPIIGWKQQNGTNMTWDNPAQALEACDFDGWRGYVCEYPSGKRLPLDWLD